MSTVGQILGFLAMALSILMLQTDKRKSILFMQAGCNFLFILHYLFIGALTGAAMNVVAGTRTMIFSFSEKKWASSPLWVVFFLAVTVAMGVWTWEGPVSLFFMASICLKTVAIRWGSTKVLRRVYFLCSALTLVYDVFSFSLAGILTEGFAAASSVVAMIRFDLLKKPEKSD